MQAIAISRHGGPDVLELVDRPTPEPGPGQVRVRHQAVGLNFIDIYQRSGLYPVSLPTILGQEAAGVVDAIGPGVDGFSLGESVAYTSLLGAYAEYNVVTASRLLHVPPGISPETVAASLLKGLTAEYLLHRTYAVKAGEIILVHAAAGGVGQILVQWAKALGAAVIGTVGSADKAVLARSLGCEHVILYREEDVATRVKEITNSAGVRVVYDSVGAATFTGSLSSLGRRGLFVSFGNASGSVPAVEPAQLQRAGSVFLTRPTLADYIATREELDAGAAALFHVIRSGAVKIAIDQRFPLAETRRAHETLESRRTTGSSLLIP